MNSKRGFTLIELLVVIAIIGLLSSVILASLNAARAKGRDAQRRSDLHQLQIGVELYYDKNGVYPSDGTTFAATDLAGLVPSFLPGIPRDPKVQSGATDYRYSSAGTSAGYALLAWLEKNGTWCRVSSGTDDPGLNWINFPRC
jgi:prepilin-type N-terminal cleavage/methylation domain-containing protein